MTNTMNETISSIDHAAQQNDRWMFIAMLVVLLVVGVIVWRWMISDREKISTRLTEMTDRHIAETEKMIEVVANNTAVLHEVKRKLE